MGKTIRVHKLAEVWPPLSAARLKRLTESIRKEGLDDPIVLYEGRILDGRNRYAACQAAGVEPRFVTFDGSLDEALAFTIRKNTERRHLTPGQEEAVHLLQIMEALRTRDRIREWRKSGGEAKKRTTVMRLDDVREADAALFDRVMRGEVDLIAAENILRRQRLHDEVKPLPKGRFNLIYADPPWRFNDVKSTPKRVTTRDAERHYATMALEEIKAMRADLPVAKDCVLFLWATASLLTQALETMDAWGFRYINHFMWDKGKIGLGRWLRGQHELLLLGVKGDISPPPQSVLVSSVITEARREHSRKPDRAYEIIERYYPNAKKLELFARAARKGWTVWGAEAPATDA